MQFVHACSWFCKYSRFIGEEVLGFLLKNSGLVVISY